MRTVSRSLSHVHAFVTSGLDYCCSALVGLPLALFTHLDRILRSAARLIGCVPKYAQVSAVYMWETLHILSRWTSKVYSAAP